MKITNDFINFEETSIIIGINKYTLGRVKVGYLKEYIVDKLFNIRRYTEDAETASEARHLAQLVYYALFEFNDEDDEALSVYLSDIAGKSEGSWYRFIETELFSVDRNPVVLSWHEKKMSTVVYQEVLKLDKSGCIKWDDYIY